MSEREEALIKTIIKFQNKHNSLNIDEEIEKYKKDIKETEKIIIKTKNDIENLSNRLKDLKNHENKNSEIEKSIEDKRNELNNKSGINFMKKGQLDLLEKNNENFKNKEYILQLIKHWTPQTMFKYIQLYDKKPEQNL